MAEEIKQVGETVERTRYSDEELAEFKEIILDMLVKAKAEYNTLRGAVMRTSSNDIEDTSPSFKTVEDDGANQLSKEEASQLAARQYKFIQNLEAALARIENKTYGYQVFNPIVEGHKGNLHHNNVIVADYTWKINRKNVLRVEAEWLGSDSKYDYETNDKRAGSWIMGLVEYNFTSAFFISISDQYPYKDGVGNYYNFSVGYNHGATRIQVGYGKQREGLLCIGGVCRVVPASNGLTFSLTTSF